MLNPIGRDVQNSAAYTGVVGIILFATIMLGFTLFPNEASGGSDLPIMIIFYAFFGGFILFFFYLALRTVKFKVVVDGDKITVYPMFFKPYSLTFNEISSVVREESFNRLKSELLEIKTTTGKLFVVDSAYISYERFSHRIRSEVKSEFLDGFD